jgi:hypothetical protein
MLAFPPPPSGDIDAWTAYMGLASLTSDTVLRLREYLDNQGSANELDKQMSMFVLLGASPDWQVL